MNLIRWEPFREFDDLLRRFSPVLGRAAGQSQNGEWLPVANISETESEYLIKAELPEVNKDDVKVMVDNGLLTIRGERKQQKEHKDENEIRVESMYGSFSRTFSLPDNVDTAAIHAESRDGVLRVHLPKSSQVKLRAKTIEVK